MGSVLGVSVGASAIRTARPAAPSPNGDRAHLLFDLQAVDVTKTRSEDLAAESIGVARAAGDVIDATAISYRSEQHAKSLHAAMARQHLDNYELVPEVAATLEYLDSTGDIQGYSTLAIYDLGSSGLSISIVDAATSAVLYVERTSEISGDYFDTLIREQQIASGRLGHPQSPAEFAALDALCRNAKEQLSDHTAVALPTDEGLVLLSRENFDTLVTLAVEASARLTRDVIMHSDQSVQAIVAVGGGARIPLVQSILRKWMNMPVIVPEGPESVAARGAAMLARPVAPQREEPPIQTVWMPAKAKQTQKREISGAGLAVSSLVVLAAIGLMLGYGGQMLERGSDSSGGPTTTLPTPPPRTTTLEPSNAVAPVRTATVSATTTSNVPAAPAPVQQIVAPPTTPPPPSVEIPGLPPILLPTLPSNLPTLPPLPSNLPTIPSPPPLPPPPNFPPLPQMPRLP